MKLCPTLFVFLFLCAGIFNSLKAQEIVYPDSWGKSGISLERSAETEVILNFSISRFTIYEKLINGETKKELLLPGNFLPNDAGMPNLPGLSRFVAIPRGASVELQVLQSRTETISGLDIAPAPDIPAECEDGPLRYEANQEVYTNNALYPENPVLISEQRQIRGVDVVLVGITPFQYNPVTKELIVHRDMKLQLTFNGGSGIFSDDRLRSRWWEPIVQDMVINYDILPPAPETSFKSTEGTTDAVADVEYLIISPDDPTFLAWADSIKNFRIKQGVSTGVVTTTEIGGNSFAAIESYIDNAYYNWNPAPSAILLLGDHGTTGNTVSSSNEEPHPYSGTYISDNYYADVDGDALPDIILARITAQNASHLEIMIGKMLDYERNPPTNPNFYNNPVTAMGWQTERWFQLCSEIINGFWEIELGKAPVRENAIYSGTPGSQWSTATNTEDVVDYFGPNGLGYIPATPEHLNDWGGNATRINNDINSGAFMIQHRDHGSETSWGEPDYHINDMSDLHNDDLTFVFSINCLTGKYNWSSECFTEAFHRYEQRALGVVAASEVSYSFVNDTYTWGMYDNMWPQFMPDEETWFGTRFIYPAFANAAGKYFLQQSDWPYNTGDKEITYYLFHHHGGAYMNVYSEIPQNLSVTHNDVLEASATSFTVTADDGSVIALTNGTTILAVADGTGEALDIAIPAQAPGDTMCITVTKQNYYRYSADVPVIESSGAYITIDSYAVNDTTTGNGNGKAEYGETDQLDVWATNLGSEPGGDISAELSSVDAYLTITDNTHHYGFIDTNAVVAGIRAFTFDVAADAPDQHSAGCTVTFTDTSGSQWQSNIAITLNAPDLGLDNLFVDDSELGNGDNVLDPDETADILIETFNQGHADAYTVNGTLTSLTSGVTVINDSYTLDTLMVGDTLLSVFRVEVDASVSLGSSAFLECRVAAGAYTAIDTFEIIIGDVPIYYMQDATIETDNAVFFDSGGPDETYAERERYTMTFKPAGDYPGLTVSFTDFDVSSGDELHIHDGVDTNAPEAPGSPFSGTTLPPDYSSTNPDGALTFYFSSNLIFNGAGWRADITPQVISAVEQPEFAETVESYALGANYPNPFNPTTTIVYTLPEAGAVSLKVYNIMGQEVRTLIDQQMSAGAHQVRWDGKNDVGQPVTSGVYFYEIRVAQFKAMKKMLLIK